MFKPEEIPSELPEEIKTLLGTLKPESPALLERRQRLLASLDSEIASSQGRLRAVFETLRAVFLAMQPQVPFQARLAEDFSRALTLYVKEVPSQVPPPLLVECMGYLRERVESMGLGSVMEKALAS